jgi:cyclic pyranopterin phosphate synthase
MGAPVKLIDSFGRIATDLRISLTDRCQLRCTYCMPEDGLQWLRKSELLDDDEITRLASVFVGLGVDSIRLTGGEPTLHPRLAASTSPSTRSIRIAFAS